MANVRWAHGLAFVDEAEALRIPTEQVLAVGLKKGDTTVLYTETTSLDPATMVYAVGMNHDPDGILRVVTEPRNYMTLGQLEGEVDG